MTQEPKSGLMATAEVSAKFEAKAAQSQTVLLFLAGIDLALFLVGAAFLWFEKIWPGVVFVVIAAVAFAMLFLSWSRSQADSDQAGAAPTLITTSDGTSLSTDLRALTSAGTVENLSRILDLLVHRKPLPVPVGFVDENGELAPGTQARAAMAVAAINQEVHSSSAALVDELGIAGRVVTSSALPTHHSANLIETINSNPPPLTNLPEQASPQSAPSAH